MKWASHTRIGTGSLDVLRRWAPLLPVLHYPWRSSKTRWTWGEGADCYIKKIIPVVTA